MRQFLRDLEVVPHASDPITIHYDSMSVIGHTKNTRYDAKIKHIDVKFNLIKKQSEDVAFEYIPMKCMIADPLTKPLNSLLFINHVRALGLHRW